MAHDSSTRLILHLSTYLRRISVHGKRLRLRNCWCWYCENKNVNGAVRTIQEVRYVKGLKKNLLSIGQLDDLGCKTHIEGGILKVVRGALVVIKAEKLSANLYILMGETLQEGDV